jgi:hypothetical protein
MSMLPGKKRAEVKQPRVKHDWYTENRWAAEQLFAQAQLPCWGFVGAMERGGRGEARRHRETRQQDAAKLREGEGRRAATRFGAVRAPQ